MFAAAKQHGVEIPTACVGKGTCGLCRIKIIEGEDTLPPYSEVEAKHLGNVYFVTKTRLSCQTIVGDKDIVVEILPRPTRKSK